MEIAREYVKNHVGYLKTHPEVFGYCHTLLQKFLNQRIYSEGSETNQDLMQTIWLAALQSGPVRTGDNLDAPQAYWIWLRKIAHNKIVDGFRRQASRMGKKVDFDKVAETVEANSDREDPVRYFEEADCVLDEAFRQLPEDYQKILHLLYWEGRSLEDGTSILGRTYKAVKTLHYRAKKRLRKEILKVAKSHRIKLRNSPNDAVRAEVLQDMIQRLKSAKDKKYSHKLTKDRMDRKQHFLCDHSGNARFR